MAWFNELIIKFRNYPLSDENLDEVIETFNNFFIEYDEKNNFFVNSENIDFENPNTSAQLVQLKENKKSDLDDLINELRNNLKYNFFSYFWEKKENLKLIKTLTFFLRELDKKLEEQNSKLLALEKDKTWINENEISKPNQTNTVNNDIKNYFDYFSFFSKTLSNDLNDLKEINLKILENKQNFLKEIQTLKNEINKEKDKLLQKNADLQKKKEKIFENLFKEEVMTQLILSFWAFRIKNNEDEYRLILKEEQKFESNFNKNFLYFFELIDDIFNNYIKKNIENEEIIYNDIFQKYNERKKELISEEKENTKRKDKAQANIELTKNRVATQNKSIFMYQNEIKTQQKAMANWKKRKQNIKTKKITYLHDWEENKNNLSEEITNTFKVVTENENIKKAHKQYLKAIDIVIKQINADIKQKNKEIIQLQDNIIRDNAELQISNKKIKDTKNKTKEIEEKFKYINYKMVSELKKIKEKWIQDSSKNQNIFINFLKEINNLKNNEFIKIIENYWTEKADNIKKFNEKFNVENNLKSIKAENEKIVTKIEDTFKTLESNFKLQEEKIITNAISEKKEKLKEFLWTINKIKTVNVETQTGVNQENEKISWQEQKIEQQEQVIEKLEYHMSQLEQKLIDIKQAHEDEVTDLAKSLTNLENFFITKNQKTMENCDKLKDALNKKNSKKEEERICNQLFEEELKLSYLNEIGQVLNSEISDLSQPLTTNSKIEDTELYDEKLPAEALTLKTTALVHTI